MGVVIGTRAFVAAVLGGIGSIPGAMLGGVLIGVLGELVKLTDYSGGLDVLVSWSSFSCSSSARRLARQSRHREGVDLCSGSGSRPFSSR